MFPPAANGIREVIAGGPNEPDRVNDTRLASKTTLSSSSSPLDSHIFSLQRKKWGRKSSSSSDFRVKLYPTGRRQKGFQFVKHEDIIKKHVTDTNFTASPKLSSAVSVDSTNAAWRNKQSAAGDILPALTTAVKDKGEKKNFYIPNAVTSNAIFRVRREKSVKTYFPEQSITKKSSFSPLCVFSQ